MRKGLVALISALALTGSAGAVQMTRPAEEAAEKHLSNSINRENERVKENWTIAAWGAAMESRIVEPEYGKFTLPTRPKKFFDAGQNEVGYFITLENDDECEGYLVLGERIKLNKLMEDVKGSSGVHLIVKDFKRDYWPKRKIDGMPDNPRDRVYGHPIQMEDATFIIYKLQGKKIEMKVRELRRCYMPEAEEKK